MILLIDNYDSFVYNLARYIEELGFPCRVVRNDVLNVTEALSLQPRAIILSPGPCAPNDAGISIEMARTVAARGDIALLGVCLGHQAVVQALGGHVRAAYRPMHGMAAQVFHKGGSLFSGIPSTFTVGRYHSLAADVASNGKLQACAWDKDGEIMAVEHKEAPVFGVQFHPESILSEHGHLLLANFLNFAGMKAKRVPQWAA
ncbi:MAG: aminodeoxychorismate/anthranilate synthase component II [Hyphomicrobiales bacterium]|nr:aminodeoxychorismate/anthranilate synthase component II [Hyphomicrobiales bacterium]